MREALEKMIAYFHRLFIASDEIWYFTPHHLISTLPRIKAFTKTACFYQLIRFLYFLFRLLQTACSDQWLGSYLFVSASQHLVLPTVPYSRLPGLFIFLRLSFVQLYQMKINNVNTN